MKNDDERKEIQFMTKSKRRNIGDEQLKKMRKRRMRTLKGMIRRTLFFSSSCVPLVVCVCVFLACLLQFIFLPPEST
jgi:lipopolysaccharide/colanic/teichoic acid biosynthesis glycosyltransferase